MNLLGAEHQVIEGQGKECLDVLDRQRCTGVCRGGVVGEWWRGCHCAIFPFFCNSKLQMVVDRCFDRQMLMEPIPLSARLIDALIDFLLPQPCFLCGANSAGGPL